MLLTTLSNDSTNALKNIDKTLAQLIKLHKDASRMKFDKLEVLRQNLEAQQDGKKYVN